MNTTSRTQEPTHRRVLAVAIPIMLSNISTPLLGIVDTAVIGSLGEPAAIGAVAVGAMVFTIAFWAFGFLRMGTSGLVAQAVGQGNTEERDAILGRALLIALSLGATLVACQWPIRELALFLVDGSAEVEARVRTYFDLRIWAAPATLANYALVGWFVGRARAKTALGLQVVLNSTNIALDAAFVLGFDWGIAGIAAGTLCAEYGAATLGLVLAACETQTLPARSVVLSLAKLRGLVNISGNIMVRTLALMFVFAWFTAEGATHGDVILATNAILMHMISTSAYFLDGLAHAAETFVGQAVGSNSLEKLKTAIIRTGVWTLIVATANTAAIWLGGTLFIELITPDPAVHIAASRYIGWVVAAPLAGALCFQLDGIFIGATRTREMRNAMLVSTAIFMLAWWLLQPWGNQGLWAALFVHYAARTLTLLHALPAVLRSPKGS